MWLASLSFFNERVNLEVDGDHTLAEAQGRQMYLVSP
jgi:hypothetical protein